LGSGPVTVIVPGYAMSPRAYRRTAALLSDDRTVAVPDLFAVSGRWRYPDVVDRLEATVRDLGEGPVMLIAHSFGGGIALGLAARRPDLVSHLVMVDTLAVSRQWSLALEATSHPLRLLRMATPASAADFFRSWLSHPRQLVAAAWWGFRSGRESEIEAIASSPVSSHVLWANRDSLLSREDGARFATELRASFTVADSRVGPIDHDWIYRHPQLFVDHLRQALGEHRPSQIANFTPGIAAD
jgi:pimeloyl-ACP methyl ester carboxylesterase